MPQSVNVVFSEVIDQETKTLHPPEKLKSLFDAKGIDLNRPIVASCGSGVTASILYVAFEQAGAKNVSVYDG
jgi:thiosulfate/3-mercaptopyruvate sulfurtransferase